MHFNIPAVIAALGLATTAAADRMIVSSYCFTLACNHNGEFITDHGRYRVDASDGCRDPDVPAMKRLCIDQKRARGHFQFNGQGRRCMKETKSDFKTCSDDFQFASCSTSYWDEVPCTW
ncbi:hypothetical protein jhhlp_008873 [Lomentospora prolificans]|uniref:Cyanovirin-N domain-containing protein n=1 Tax=Lomentospora prolificans TaxID=41688 RepID=A0A2N3MZA3_9PEZI|nr:hypothetical protein jhhlp_008873 [Lomentospora prolificans]